LKLVWTLLCARACDVEQPLSSGTAAL